MTRFRDVMAFAAPGRLGGWTIAALLWLLASPYYWPSATWAFGIAAGSLVLAWICYRVAGDPILGRIALASYAVRTALTLGFYAVSAWHLPVLQGLQRGDGFLQIGGDGFGYHVHALKILDAWRLGVDLPFMFGMGLREYDLYRNLALPVAWLYRILGPSVVHALLANAWMGALSAIPAYLMAAAMAGRRRARVAAALVAFWPSSIIWSSQLLKDTSISLAVLGAFCGLVVLWRGLPEALRGWRRWGAAVLCWCGLILGAAVTTYFRFYMGLILLGTVALVMGAAGAWQLWHRRFLQAGMAVLLVAAVGASVVVIRSVDLMVLCSPKHPVPNLFALGEAARRAGNLEHAVLYYLRVVHFQPDHEQALASLRVVVREAPERLVTVTEQMALDISQVIGLLVRSGRLSGSEIADLRVQLGRLYARMEPPLNGSPAMRADAEANAYLVALWTDPGNRGAVERLHGAVIAELDRRRVGPGLLSDDVLMGALWTLSRSGRVDQTEIASLFFRLGQWREGSERREHVIDAYIWALEANPQYRPAADALVRVVDEELRRRQRGASAIGHRTLLGAVNRLKRIRRYPKEPFSLRALTRQAAAALLEHPVPPAATPSSPPVQPPVTYTWPQQINNYRVGMIRTGGNSLVDTEVTFSNVRDLVTYLPRAWMLAFLAPFPSQWFNLGGETGVFRLLSGFEVVLLYLLLWPIARAAWGLLQRQGPAGWCLVLFSGLTATILPYVVPNLGIFFRLRLQYLLPLLVAVGVAGTLPFPGAPRQIWARLRRMRPSWRGGEAVAGRVAAWYLVPGVLAGLLVLAQWPVTTRFGVNYQWSSKRITLFEKAVDFVSRDLQAKRLAAEVTRGAATPDAKLLQAFAWVGSHVRPTPEGFPVVDDHILHIIIRGYGAPDQRTEAFALLAGYAGIPAAPATLRAPGTDQAINVAVARSGGKTFVFDVDHGLVFKNDDGALASLEELARDPQIVERAAGSLAVGGVPYTQYFLDAQNLQARFSRIEGQRLWPRLRQEAAGVFGRGPEGAR